MRIISIVSKKYGTHECYVDDDNYDRAMQYTWHLHAHPSTMYAMTNVKLDGKCTKLYMHRFLFPTLTGRVNNHRDKNGLNNTRNNLQETDYRGNNQDRAKNKGATSQYYGVCFTTRDKRWKAQVMLNKRSINIGYFDSEEEAAEAWNKAADAINHNGPRNKIPNKG